MSAGLRTALLVSLGAICGAWAQNGQAAVATVTASPAEQNIAFGGSRSMRVTWTVTYAAPAVPTTVISRFGILRAGPPFIGPIVARVPVVIRREFPAGNTVAVFRESVSVPEQAILAAQELGFTEVGYEREFDDGGGADVGDTTFNITGSGGAALSISRVGLRFPDNTRVKVMAPGTVTHVLADISYSGTGRFEAVWEIADPSSTRGNPHFRTVRVVRRQLIAGQQITLRSPELPTHSAGVHLARLRIASPAAGFESPVIRYLINSALKPRASKSAIQVLQPAEGSVVTPDTRFSWSPIPGAKLYQVEFGALHAPTIAAQVPSLGEPGVEAAGDDAESDDGYPIAGIMVGGSTKELSLSPLSLSRLTPGSSYWWRVQAYDEQGDLIGSSPRRTVALPFDAKRPRAITPLPPEDASADAPP